ncbi:MAG: aminoacyl-tRNA deacylase [Terriglobales bacterium]
MPLARLKEYLDSHNIKYETIYHSTAYTAQEIASRAHVPGKELAKTVIVKADDELVMAVLPASDHVDTYALRNAIGASTARLATEFEFKDRFPDCETGAMPPFGNLYGMKVYVDERLTKDTEIAFNACSHRELLRMSYADYARLVQPVVLRFAAGRVTAA